MIYFFVLDDHEKKIGNIMRGEKLMSASKKTLDLFLKMLMGAMFVYILK